MPQGETFWNPYRLIPVKENIERCAPWTDERFRGNSGMIQCTIENLTPLFIGWRPSGSHHPPLQRDGKQIIPGSSLKGMLRSLAETVGGGCFVVKDNGNRIPDNLNTCKQVTQLCIACRMFGAMERGANARVHKGKVSIGDALITETKLSIKSLPVLLSNNGVRHEPFYRSEKSGKLDWKSRKLYFHQPKHTASTTAIPQEIQSRAWNIDAMLPGHHFDVDIQFTSLTDQELGLLLYIIHLEEQVHVRVGENISLKGPMRHKIGNAKPVGMGSCHIRLKRLTYLAPPARRFASMTPAENQVFENEALKNEILKKTGSFCADQSPTMIALRKMMVWDENDPRGFHYPDYTWFKDTTHNTTVLKSL